ncbi:MAG: phosphodiester glycosidase family protein [Candidatus Sericytochromatia bacterium]|nr:phosphodiester glycosidase family protein [Candidatus Sericytochromatia bacterium]
MSSYSSGHWRRKACLIIGLVLLLTGCQPTGCQPQHQPRFGSDRFPLNPKDIFDISPATPVPVRQFEQLSVSETDLAFASALKTPPGYRRVRTLQIADGVIYRQFERGGSHTTPDPRYTLRVLLIHPRAFTRLHVLFSDTWDQPLYTQTVLNRPGVQALMSWCFFGRIPAGDMIGWRCRQRGASCVPGIYYEASRRTGKNIHQRYTLALNHPGQVRMFRGGLGKDSRRWYRMAMGGGMILFDQTLAPSLYYAVGRPNYNRLFSSKVFNHADIVKKGQAGDPQRAAPRSAAGTLPGGSLVFANLGEGQYRFRGGATPAYMAWLMKQMGLNRALLFDGGGAPQMILKTPQGRQLVRTYPENTQTSNYLYNYAFLTLQRP